MSDIRVGGIEDLETVMEIEQAAHQYPWSEKIMTRYLRKPDSVWVLEVDGEHSAHAVISAVADEAELLMISVRPEMQGRGYGKALLARVSQWLQEKGIISFFLEVRESNESAIGLYESLGFNEVGRRPGYYPHPDGREDALIYSLELCD
ncbi:MAG: ribosomal protein S18-alanine N-acetyltransferase [Pseudomonadota bacterium]|jgi:ribosomal-protein-alanine N-acetyltransferase|nr:ribosomal protein S18-alanine N-acetyltransferase [Pseudomonadota bacterium]MEE3210024.1 ribosomal protein S18-alanine N-acetyltransferase [Pseudomonadota bacterium]